MRKLFFALAALCAVPAMAQSVSPILQPHQTFVDSSGSPCTGCLLYSYSAGTTSPLATYTDSTGLVQNTNPVILDAAGGAQIWVTTTPYKFALYTATGSLIWTVDHVTAPSGGGGGGGGMVYPPAGLGASTGAAWRTPTYADVMALWSGCSGGGATYVLFNGQCGNGGATLASNTFIGTQTLLSAGAALTPLVVRQTTGATTVNVQQAADTGGSSVIFSRNLMAASTIVIVVMQSDGGTTPALSDTLSNVYTVAAEDHLGGYGRLTVLTAPNPNPGADTVAFTNAGSLASPYMVGYEITGLASVSVVDTTGTSHGTSLASPQTSPSVTTSASDMIITTLEAYANSGLSAFSSYINMLSAGNANTSVSAYSVLPSGTYTSSWTNNAATGGYSMVTVALKVSSSTVQTADLAQFQDTTSAVLARIDNVGGLHVPSCVGCGTGLASQVTTGASISATCGTLYYNQDATTGASITLTLPAPVANPVCQVCLKNSNNGAANTGTLEMLVANTGTQSIILNGNKTTASGFIQSAGAAGDGACLLGISSTQWEAYPSTGVWTVH